MPERKVRKLKTKLIAEIHAKLVKKEQIEFKRREKERREQEETICSQLPRKPFFDLKLEESSEEKSSKGTENSSAEKQI